jgi:hypothetical protein
MENGVVEWAHHNEYDREVFSVVTDPVVTQSKYGHTPSLLLFLSYGIMKS